MSGSKNTELTVKYVWTLLAAISLGFRNSVLVSNSTNPTAAKTTASPVRSSRQVRSRSRVHRSRRNRQNSNENGT